MKKQMQTLDTEKKRSLSDLEKQTKRTEQLGTEKRELLRQLEEKRPVSGNY